MTRRQIIVNDERWDVYPSGRLTVYPRDEFGLLFEHGTGSQRRRRFTRYSPVGSRTPQHALRELSDRELMSLFHHSQPAWTAPEAAYGAR